MYPAPPGAHSFAASLRLPSLHTHSSSHVRCSRHAGFRNGSKWGPTPGAELCTAPLGTASAAPNRSPSEQGLRATLGVRGPKEKMSRVTGAVHAQLHPLQEQELTHTAHPHECSLAHSCVCEQCPAPGCTLCWSSLQHHGPCTRRSLPSHTHALSCQHSTGQPTGSGCRAPLPCPLLC